VETIAVYLRAILNTQTHSAGMKQAFSMIKQLVYVSTIVRALSRYILKAGSVALLMRTPMAEMYFGLEPQEVLKSVLPANLLRLQ
jgi:hypothetical protein